MNDEERAVREALMPRPPASVRDDDPPGASELLLFLRAWAIGFVVFVMLLG